MEKGVTAVRQACSRLSGAAALDGRRWFAAVGTPEREREREQKNLKEKDPSIYSKLHLDPTTRNQSDPTVQNQG